MITYIWGTSGGPARFAIHFGYPIGSMLGPLMAVPFVYGESDDANSTTTESPDLLQEDGAWVESKHFDDGSSIEYVYFLIAVFIWINASVFIIFQVFRRRMHVTAPVSTAPTLDEIEEKQTFKKVLTPSEWADGDGRFGCFILVALIVYYVIVMAAIKGTQEYLVTYAVDSNLFSAQEAATLNSVVYGAGSSLSC